MKTMKLHRFFESRYNCTTSLHLHVHVYFTKPLQRHAHIITFSTLVETYHIRNFGTLGLLQPQLPFSRELVIGFLSSCHQFPYHSAIGHVLFLIHSLTTLWIHMVLFNSHLSLVDVTPFMRRQPFSQSYMTICGVPKKELSNARRYSTNTCMSVLGTCTLFLKFIRVFARIISWVTSTS